MLCVVVVVMSSCVVVLLWSLCRCGHCVVDVVMPWHWPSASRQRCRVVRRPSTSCIMRRCVVHRVLMCCASTCRASCVVCQCVVVVVMSLWSSCCRCRDAMALAICVTAAASCRPSSVNIVHRASMCRALSCIMHRVSACRRRHVVRRRVVRRRDAMAMAICIVSLSSCHRVVRAYRPSWVVIVVMPWQWASASCHCHGSPCCGSLLLLCRALWVAVGRWCVSAGAENVRDLPPGHHHLRR